MTWTWLGIVVAGILLFLFCIGYRRGFIKEIVSTFFVVLAIGIVWFINPYVNNFIRENTPVYENVQNTCSEFVAEQVTEISTPDKSQQESIIDNLALPELLKNEIEKNNTAEVYSYLAVNTFAEYVSGYLAMAVVNGISFVVSFILATLLIRILSYALNIIASLPVIRGVNKAAGALVGLVKGVLFIWVAFVILTVLCNTGVGQMCMELVEKDTFLSCLYNQNILMKVFMSIFYGSV